MTLERFGLSTGRPPTRTSSTGAGDGMQKTTPPKTVVRQTATAPQGEAGSAAARSPDREGFLERLRLGAEEIRDIHDNATRSGRTPRALVFSDMDVDGITSHTILRALLQRVGYTVEPMFSKKFSDDKLEAILASDADLLVITDHASPPRDTFGTRNVLVIDHHKPPDATQDHSHQLHPMLYGLNGSTEICSAGIGYLLARAIDATQNRDLSALGVIGSAGDMMDHEQGRFIGLTASDVVGDAVRHGLVEKKLDLRLYGRHGRSLTQLLCYADDPALAGLSKNMDACRDFLIAQGLNPEDRWCHLDTETQQRLVGLLLDRARDPTRLLGDVCELVHEPVGGHLRDVREYATVINGSSRYEMPEPVVAILLGDRGRHYETALDNYLNHKRNIVNAIRLIQSLGVTAGKNLQWFHVEGLVRHTIVGSVAGAVQSRYDPHKPMIAFAYEADDLTNVKVSGRGNRALCEAGLDLSRVMRECAETLGGRGGGHDVAAGATIPAGTEPVFLEHAERILQTQIGHLRRPDALA